MSVLVDTRPPGIDHAFRPSNPAPLTIVWSPTGTLSGRTFTATLDAITLGLVVVGDTMTITATEAQTITAGLGAHVFKLTETTGGASNDLIIGTWTGSDLAGTAGQTVQVTQGAATVTISYGSSATVASSLVSHIRLDAQSPLYQPLARFRAEATRARQGGVSTATAWLGDSLTEAYEPSKRHLRWIDRLAARLNGPRPAKTQYIPITTNAFSTTTATDWPGDQAPWTYNGTVTGSVNYGADLHAATLDTGAFVELPYRGDVVSVAYVRTPTGPAAAAVTIDGVSVGTINANGAELPGQLATFGTIGDYGSHVLRVTATGAPLVLEGAVVHDGTRFGFGVPFDSIWTYCFGHAGFQTSHFTGNSNWSKSFASIAGTASLVGIVLGANDIGAGVLAATYQANLVAIMAAIDAAIVAAGGTSLPGFLLVQMPGRSADYLDAAWGAAAAHGAARCAVLDLAARLPDNGADWDLMDAGNGHPNDVGQLWIANTIAEAIDPACPQAPTTPVAGPIIEATDEPAARSNWALTLEGGTTGTLDASPTGTGTHERRHRVWLDAGTYTPRLRCAATGTNATCEVLVGATSAGTATITGSNGAAFEATLSGVAVDSPGWYPVTIRKTGANTGAVRLSRLYLRRS